MEIMITETAQQKLAEKTTGRAGYIKLKYDTDGCGCAVNGVAALWLVDKLEENDEEIATDITPIYIEKSKMVFFDGQMTIDFNEAANCFQLKSPNEYINPRMSFVDTTER
ncbi:iron-sulfur cluster biosynthesis family protein [Bacillus sp. T33-2]|uniref:iron-sulfur cluster biosynthesis family protein n=1 Tax=Bacillus sp. T33-2 TaxID=2054168 RepID=UPI000C77D2AD|nr:iron-sulfur cluster biosynthesis family protein [Bacillus sp. T33-2]PLR99830.1 heme biosynthesis protein HemY [Bacillus sp. T33-2]